MSTNDLVAAFLAKGGKVTKVETGKGAGLTDREWGRLARDANRRYDSHLVASMRRGALERMEREAENRQQAGLEDAAIRAGRIG